MTCQNCMLRNGSSGWASNNKECVRLEEGVPWVPWVDWLCSFHLSLSLNAAAAVFPVAALRLMVRTEQSQVSSVAELLAALIVHTAG